ncbi:unnamed protein product [Soboliphyme baturini]|uniref:Neuronal acetylcholine receptor subunit alpha-7 n=1 Tax=Soboliphyme baturini TaxID=241478 RepID=A0A183IPT5_9BILA|nr:unnamed protein product [Soboliphyme baturini]
MLLQGLRAGWRMMFVFVVQIIRTAWTDNFERKLHDDLLMSYDTLERPVPNSSLPLRVLLEITLFQIVDVDERSQVIQTNVWLKLTWEDYNLKWDPEQYGGLSDITLPADKIWKPDVLLYNSVDSNFANFYPSNLVVYSSGTITWIPPGIVRSSCKMDITWFPFDDQLCCLKFGSWTYNSLKLDLRKDKDGWDMSEYLENGEWLLIEYPVNRSKRLYECCPDEPYYDLKFCLHIRRRTLFYGFNLIIPSLLISLMTLLGFALPVESGEKVTLEITILLSVCVFLGMVSQMTPTTSEAVSLLGVFFACHMLVVSASVVCNVIVLQLHYRTPDTNIMGEKTRALLINWLPWLLMMQRPGKTFSRQIYLWKKEKKPNNKVHKDVESEIPGTSKTADITKCSNERELLLATSRHDSNMPLKPPIVDNQGYLIVTLSKIQQNVEYIANQLSKENADEDAKNDWKFAAVVVDRLCLIFFSIFIVLSTVIIFTSAPHLYV